MVNVAVNGIDLSDEQRGEGPHLLFPNRVHRIPRRLARSFGGWT